MVPSIEQEIHDLHALIGSPRDPEGRAFVPLADAYRRAGDPSRALDVLADGLERHPGLAAGHLVAGLTLRDLADDTGAESAFRRVLDLDADNARALVGLGRLLDARGDEMDGSTLVERGLALDPTLSREGAPDRIPRHSHNPEVVGTPPADPPVDDAYGGEGLAPMEWEVVEAASDAELVEMAALAPEGVEGTEAPDESALRDDEPREFLVSSDAEEALLAAVVGEAGGDLDIDWDVEGAEPEPPVADDPVGEASVADDPVGDASAAEEPVGDAPVDGLPVAEEPAAGEPAAEAPLPEPEPTGAEPDPTGPAEGAGGDDELVLEAAALAPDDWEPDGWTPDEAPPGAGPAPAAVEEAGAIAPADDDLLMELADLAPDIEPGSRHPAPDGGDDEVLPTRTLGELYARQGLLDQAVKVFEHLVSRSPADPDLRARLDQLRARRTAPRTETSGPEPRAAEPRAAEPAPEPEVADDPPVSAFFAHLLAWSPDAADAEADR